MGLQCSLFANTCTKGQKDGNAWFRDLPLASPSFGNQIRAPSSGAETIQSGSRPRAAAATTQRGEQLEALVRAHHSRKQLFPVISAS